MCFISGHFFQAVDSFSESNILVGIVKVRTLQGKTLHICIMKRILLIKTQFKMLENGVDQVWNYMAIVATLTYRQNDKVDVIATFDVVNLLFYAG